MIDRDTIDRTIREAYAARQRGDHAGVVGFFAPNATYRMVGKSHLLGDMPMGPIDAAEAIAGLIDQFHFPHLDLAAVLIDGHRAAVHVEMHAVATGNARESASELLDLWTFDDDGKVTDITEFADTALISHMLFAA
jgi:ketosteroid isomerase-like protein